MQKIMYGVFNSKDMILDKDEEGHYGFYYFESPHLLKHHKIDATHLLYDAKKELEGIRGLKNGGVMNPYYHKYDSNLTIKEVEVNMLIKNG